MRPSLRFLLVAVLLPAGCTPPSSSGDAGVPAVFSASGSLVPDFGGGVVTSNPTGGNDEGAAIVVAGEFYYVAGTQRGTGTSSEVQWRLEKRDLEGNLRGYANSDPTSSIDEPKALISDGTHLYIVGAASAAWRVEKRLLSDLSLVTAFGVGGAVTNSPLSFFSSPAAAAVDSAHLYIVGKDDNQWRIEKRRLDTGDLETAGFGGNTGVVLSNPTF